jgi:hypothetical protein
MISMRKMAFCVAAFLPLAAAAAPVTYEFSVTLGGFAYEGEDVGTVRPPPMPYGTELFGRFTIEGSTPIAFESPGFTQYNNLVTAAQLDYGPAGSLGSHAFLDVALPSRTSSSHLAFFNDIEYLGNPPYDQFNFGASLGLLPGDAPGSRRSFEFVTGSFDTGLLPAGLMLADPWPVDNLLANRVTFYTNYLLLDADGNRVDAWSMSGYLATLRQVPTSVPEPATLSLLGAGLLALGFRRRRAA